MSDTYEINEFEQVVPYTSGRLCNDTRAWRDATELELQQRDEISRLETVEHSARYILEDADPEKLADACGLPLGVITAALRNILSQDQQNEN